MCSPEILIKLVMEWPDNSVTNIFIRQMTDNNLNKLHERLS